MSKKVSETKTFKIVIASLILFMNIAFYTFEAPGMGTGFSSAWDMNPLFGIAMALLIGCPFLAYLYFIIRSEEHTV